MSKQGLENEIRTEFSLNENSVTDEFIAKHADIMWINEEIEYMVYVPSYMLWCLKNKDNEGSLVFDYTVNALAEFGCSKNPKIKRLNFKFLCDDKQKKVVCKFLNWCQSSLLLKHEEQLDRAIKNWDSSKNQ